MSALKKIEGFISELYSNDKIKINKESVEENRELMVFRDNEESFEEAYEEIRIKVPKEDWHYNDIGSLLLDWSVINVENREYLYGGFLFNTFAGVLGEPSYFWKIYNDSRFWKSYKNEEEEQMCNDFLPKLNCFHKSGHGDDGTFGCLLREKGQYPCPIYFYDNGVWFEMDMSLEEYYDKMIACKAVMLWQYFYLDTSEIIRKLGEYKPVYEDVDSKGPTGGLGYKWVGLYYEYYVKDEHSPEVLLTSVAEGVLLHMKRVLKMFPRLFPDMDITFFQEKHDALEKALK